MSGIFSHFDTYSLKARVFPALIAGLPMFALLFVMVPWNHFGLSHAIAAPIGIVLLFALADIARQRGKSVQLKLGTGETPDQWHRDDPDIPEVSKDRFRTYVAAQLRREAPTAEEEKLGLDQVNDFYRSAGAWLRDRTRDTRTFPLLFAENITYGFRRNLLGLKPIALICNFFVLGLCIAIYQFQPPSFIAQDHLQEKFGAIMVILLLHSVYMVLAVSKNAVRAASRAYGRQLILSCDAFIER